MVPGTEYAVAKKESGVNGEVSKEDARAAAAASLSEDAEGTSSFLLPLSCLTPSGIACCRGLDKHVAVHLGHHLDLAPPLSVSRESAHIFCAS